MQLSAAQIEAVHTRLLLRRRRGGCRRSEESIALLKDGTLLSGGRGVQHGLCTQRESLPHPDGRSGGRAGRGVGAPVEPVSRQAGLVAQAFCLRDLAFYG